MMQLNVRFMDLYKKVDRFIRDAYSSPEGVSEYLRQMEYNNRAGIWRVTAWKADYDKLKRMRWIRNQLSHEVGYDSDLCEEGDYAWLERFCQRLFAAQDPMAMLHRSIEAEQQKRAAAQRRPSNEPQKQPAPAPSQPAEQATLWQRIVAFFRNR